MTTYSKFYKKGFSSIRKWEKNLLSQKQDIPDNLDNSVMDQRFGLIIDKYKLNQQNVVKEENTETCRLQVDRVVLEHEESELVYSVDPYHDVLAAKQDYLLSPEDLKSVEQSVAGPGWKKYLTGLMKDEEELSIKVQHDHLQPPDFFKQAIRARSPKNNLPSLKKILYNADKSSNSQDRKGSKPIDIKQEIIIQIHSLIRNYQNQQDLMSQQSKVSILNEILFQIGSYKSPYQEYLLYALHEVVIQIIHIKQINQFIICKKQEILQTLREISFIEKDQELSYMEASKRLHQHILKLKKTFESQKIIMIEENKQLKVQIEQLQQDNYKIKEMSAISVNSQQEQWLSAQQDYENQFNTYKKQLTNCNQQIQELKENIYSMQDKNNQERAQTKQAADTRIKDISVEIFDLKGRVQILDEERERQYSIAEDYKRKFTTAFLSLKIAKENMQALILKNSEIENEKSRMAVRASIGFNELTPRPAFEQCYDALGLNILEIIEPQSTDMRVLNLKKLIVNKIKSLQKDMPNTINSISSTIQQYNIIRFNKGI